MACAMLYLEQWIKFCGTSTFREFIFWYNACGNTSVKEKFYNNNLSISHYKFDQGNHGSSILYLLLGFVW